MSEPISRIHPATGQRYFVDDGISRGAVWATYTRKPNGSMKRVKSPHLPQRDTPEEALLDLEAWLRRATGGTK